MEIDAGRLGRICAERDAAHSVLKQLFPDPQKALVGMCTLCSCPILHLEHVKLEQAQILEALVQAVLGMGTTDPWETAP